MGQASGATWASLILSLVGALLAAGFLIQSRAPAPTDHDLFVWAVFSTLCVLGATATLFPHHCKSSTSLPGDLDPSKFTIIKGKRLVHGHHVTCERFRHHELTLRGKTFCASCTGLFMGAFTALSVATLYFVYDYRLPAIFGYIGLGFVILGLLYIPLLNTRIPMLRSAYNALFVLGFAFLLVTVDGAGHFGFDMVLIGLCVQWMFTRIQLSRWSYDIICGGCDETCERRMV